MHLRLVASISVFVGMLAVVVAQGCGGTEASPPLACVDGSQLCGDHCAALGFDPNNCGACGVRCGTGQVCDNGACASECRGGTAACGGGCVSLTTDRANCGACGIACAAGEVCSAGKCALSCQATLTTCGPKPYCADLTNDASNCGACAKKCGGGSSCVASACRYCTSTLLLPGMPGVAASNTAEPRIGDFDEDGKLDVAYITTGTIGVALGNGNGTFRAPTNYTLGDGIYAQGLAVADVDRDSHLDVVATTNSDVHVLWGKGDGSVAKAPLAPNAFVANASATRSITAAELDGKGTLELVLADLTGVLILQNVTSLGVTVTSNHIDIPAGAASVTTADVDGDGDVDLVVPNKGSVGVLSIFLNDGAGAFSAATPVPVSPYPSSVVAANLDGDGKLDLVVESTTTDVLLGVGSGSFVAKPSLGTSSGALAVADFDSDGKLDVAANVSSSEVGFSFGLGNGTFAAPKTTPWLGAPYLVGVGDFDGDGVADLLQMVPFPEVVLNRGNATFVKPITFDVQERGQLETADLNGDGHVDLVTPPGARLGKGDGTFGPFVGSAFNDAPRKYALADFDEDGKLDWAIVGTMDAYVAMGDGKGGTAAPVKLVTGFQAAGIGAGDVTGDGHVDVVVARPNEVVVFVGDGKGGFGNAIAKSVVGDAAVATTADLNGDKRADVVVRSYNAATVLFGKADGTFLAGPVQLLGYAVDRVADLNGDGKLDLVGVSYGIPRVFFAFGKGDGTFDPLVTAPLIAPPTAVRAHDMNGDGSLDLVVSLGPGGVAVLLGNGKGSFAAALYYPILDGGYGPWLAFGDFDEDGNDDAAIGRNLLLNRGTQACGLAK